MKYCIFLSLKCAHFEVDRSILRPDEAIVGRLAATLRVENSAIKDYSQLILLLSLFEMKHFGHRLILQPQSKLSFVTLYESS